MIKDSSMLAQQEYERADNDHYPTPAWCTEALLKELRWLPNTEIIWEPACGAGDMSEVLKTKFNQVISSDIDDYDYSNTHAILNFLDKDITSDPLMNLVNKAHIITNPPFDKAEEFIKQALKITMKHRGVVCMLLRNEYDCAKKRIPLFTTAPFRMKITLTSRPRWIPGSTGSPRHNYAWYVWDWQYDGNPTIKYGLKI